jgi:hypothetical protein
MYEVDTVPHPAAARVICDSGLGPGRYEWNRSALQSRPPQRLCIHTRRMTGPVLTSLCKEAASAAARPESVVAVSVIANV